ncbi:hypothetical protein ACA910_021284 [Epithemia clementina (nom. ined.)]
MQSKIAEKLEDVRTKGYVTSGVCKATMNFFAVPKGESDICIVYDRTKSGLNDCLFAPWFPLSDGDALTNILDKGYWCIGNNYGKMFLNFWLHPDLQQFSGMDIMEIYGCLSGGRNIEIWTLCPMGQSPLPYITVQQARRLKRIMFGDRHDQNNIFHWDCIHLNLLGSQGYHPGVPWISKQRTNGQIAADAQDYVDDLWGCAPSKEDAEGRVQNCQNSRFSWSPRRSWKCHQQMQRPGAWAGAVCRSKPLCPYVSVTQERWDKTKQEIQRLKQEVTQAQDNGNCLGTHKVLDQVAGFLNHVAQAFPTIKLYLNGV